MGFNEEGFRNFQNYQKLVAANPGSTILQLMGGFKVAPGGQAGNKNPNNPNNFIYQGYTPHKPSDPGGDQSQGGDTYGEGGSPVPNALGWDSELFGDQAYWAPTDTLPNGQTVKEHLEQLQSFAWPSYSSKPSGTNFLQDIMEGISSPGIAPVLGAAGIGSFLGGAGGAAGWTSGYDLAGGGALGGGSSGLADFVGSDWASGLSSAMNPGGGMDISQIFGGDWTSGYDLPGGGSFSTTGGGTDFVGSDWSQGLPGAQNAGMGATGGGGTNLQSIIQKIMGMGGSGGTGQPGTGIPNLLSGASGLFDLFSGSPLSARGINESAAKTADPLKDDRGFYGGMLKNLMSNPGAFSLTPGAKFTLDTGTENLTRSNAARGMLGSGNILADIMKFGEGVASQDYYTMIDKLMPLSGGTTGSPASAGYIQSGQLQNRNSALANIGGGLAPVPGSPTNSGGGGVLQALGGIGSGISSIFNLFK